MNTLYIDTHLWDIVIVLYKDGVVVNKEEVINKKNNSEYIFPTIVKVIDGVKLDQIIVVNGPGSFTGVRLGVTIAKTFAYTLNIPIRTITSLECLAVSGDNHHVAISDNNGYYIGNFDNDFNLIEDYSYVSNEEFINMNIDNHIVTEQALDYEKIYSYVMICKTIENAHGVKPIYVKKIGVEM